MDGPGRAPSVEELMYTSFVSLVKSNPGTRSLLLFKLAAATNADEVCHWTTEDGRLTVECEPGQVPQDEQDPVGPGMQKECTQRMIQKTILMRTLMGTKCDDEYLNWGTTVTDYSEWSAITGALLPSPSPALRE